MSQGRRRAAAISGRNMELQLDILNYLTGRAPTIFPGGFDLGSIGLSEPIVPGAGPLLEEAFMQMGDMVSSPITSARDSALLQALGGQSAFQFDPALRQQFYRQTVQDPILRRLQTEELPQIAARFLPRGAEGAASRFYEQALGNATRDIGAITTGAVRDEERFAAQLQDSALARALGAVPMSLESQLRPISAMTQLGGISRALVGQQRGEDVARAFTQLPMFDPRLALWGAMSGNPTLVQLGSQGLGSLGSLIGGIGGMSSMAGMM